MAREEYAAGTRQCGKRFLGIRPSRLASSTAERAYGKARDEHDPCLDSHALLASRPLRHFRTSQSRILGLAAEKVVIRRRAY